MFSVAAACLSYNPCTFTVPACVCHATRLNQQQQRKKKTACLQKKQTWIQYKYSLCIISTRSHVDIIWFVLVLISQFARSNDHQRTQQSSRTRPSETQQSSGMRPSETTINHIGDASTGGDSCSSLTVRPRRGRCGRAGCSSSAAFGCPTRGPVDLFLSLLQSTQGEGRGWDGMGELGTLCVDSQRCLSGITYSVMSQHTVAAINQSINQSS